MKIEPFPAVRPDPKLAEKLIVLPYDVVSFNDVKKAIDGNPYSFFHVTRSETDVKAPANEYSSEVYEKARENFINFIKKGYLFQDESPGFYILTQEWLGRTQTGIYILVDCDDYEKGIIIKHELTRKDKEEDRTRHIRAVKADTGPVFLAFEKKPGFNMIIDKIVIKRPDYDITDENGVRSTLWAVFDKLDIENIKKYFSGIGSFFIADGHHRAASAVKIWKEKDPFDFDRVYYSHFLAVIFPSSDLKIFPYNRIIYDLGGMDNNIFLENVSRIFKTTKTYSPEPEKKGDIRMILRSGIYKIETDAETESNDRLSSLDSMVLQDRLFGPVLGIDDPRTSSRIGFIGGAGEISKLVSLVLSGIAAAAFSLFPVSMDDLTAIAGSGKIMPPKSTWFEPKLRDGLITYSLEGNDVINKTY